MVSADTFKSGKWIPFFLLEFPSGKRKYIECHRRRRKHLPYGTIWKPRSGILNSTLHKINFLYQRCWFGRHIPFALQHATRILWQVLLAQVLCTSLLPVTMKHFVLLTLVHPNILVFSSLSSRQFCLFSNPVFKLLYTLILSLWSLSLVSLF